MTWRSRRGSGRRRAEPRLRLGVRSNLRVCGFALLETDKKPENPSDSFWSPPILIPCQAACKENGSSRSRCVRRVGGRVAAVLPSSDPVLNRFQPHFFRQVRWQAPGESKQGAGSGNGAGARGRGGLRLDWSWTPFLKGRVPEKGSGRHTFNCPPV